ncbi:MAG TPA: S9 family peptidase, partial [Phycisphaerae bacterium]|nr:S9 family peptidase [Phycisphaerae bacterium]
PPAGGGISFTAKLEGDKNACLYVIPIDGGQARRVLSHDADIGAYAWSPDGRQVAFLATRKPDEQRKKMRERGFKAKVYEEDFEPTRVFVAPVSPESAGPDADQDADPRELPLEGSASRIAWSPAGDRLAVQLSSTPLVDDVMMFSRVHVVDAATGDSIGQYETAGKLGDMAFSKDGSRLALIAAEDLHDPREGRLMVGGASGGALRDVVPNYAGHVTSIAWQDDDTLMYIGHEGVWSVLGKVAADGASRKTIVATGGPVLDSISLAGDGQTAALIAGAPDHPAELYFMKHGDPGPRRLTNSNPWLSEVRLARQEGIRHAARDGVELEGILLYPLDYEPGGRYPLVLIVHGGPEAHVSNGWNTGYGRPGHVLAARGYVVFEPNYRGSTGRGVAFSKAGQRDPAGKEFDDLIDAVDHLIGVGLVDGERVGVTGGSYGGYATAWCCTRYSERFAAGVMFVGLSDVLGQYGTSDIPHEKHLVHVRTWPWENWDFFASRSPLRYVEQARTPLLIVHGEDDPRVHPSQSLMLYRYLKLLDRAPVRLVLYPGEGHGNRKAAARYDYCLRLLQWMDHYLKGPGGPPPEDELPYELDSFEAGE